MDMHNVFEHHLMQQNMRALEKGTHRRQLTVMVLASALIISILAITAVQVLGQVANTLT